MNYPMIRTVEDLILLLEISQECLDRILDPSENHYTFFPIQKKTKGTRRISKPSKELKTIQKKILFKILYTYQNSAICHGFTPGRSIVTNAINHQKAKVLINVDLKDFFHSITYRRVVGVFSSFGYSSKISNMLGIMCTAPLNPHRRKGTRIAAQGAPSSPQLSNIICKRMDDRILVFCQKHNIRYSRYADDLSFSILEETSNDQLGDRIGLLLSLIRKIITSEGFRVNEQKVRILFPKHRQEVTGITVNRYVNVNRNYCLRIRGILHRVFKEVELGQTPSFPLIQLAGSISFIKMVRPEKAARLSRKMRKIAKILAVREHSRGD